MFVLMFMSGITANVAQRQAHDKQLNEKVRVR
jgi:hypothetical protein